MTVRFEELSVVVPAYNEAQNLAQVVAEARAALAATAERWELVLVDDGSTDDTLAVMRRLAEQDPARTVVVARRANGGMGAALRDGYAAARLSWLTLLPGDGQIDPSDLSIFAPAVRRGVELITSVYEARNDGLVRTLLSGGLRLLTILIGGTRVRLEGIYVIRRSLYRRCEPRSDTLFFNLELPIRAAHAGTHIETVQIRCRPRLSGSSKVAGPGRIVRVFTELVALRWRLIAGQ